MRLSTWLSVIACLILVVIPAMAQTDRGTITGTISDPAGAVVPSASVEARNTNTGAIYKAESTSTGNFTITQLPAGTYDLTVTAPGFRTYVQQGIHSLVALTVRVDVVVQVGSPTDSVTVTADAPLLRTEGAEQSHVISAQTIDNLPLNFGGRGPGSLRDPFTFVETLPGAKIEGRNTIRVNGIGSWSFGALLEGQDLTMPMGPDNSDMVAPSVDALQEITVQTSNYSAEYGQAAGGLFNFTTRSGTNEFHGNAYEYLLNEALGAGIPFTDNGKGEHIRPRVRKHDFGVNIGGPVYIPKIYSGKDRTFFFFNYEKYFDKKLYGGTYATVPTEAFRKGDFSAILTGRNLCPAANPNCAFDTEGNKVPIMENVIYDPSTTKIVNGLRVRDPFKNNQIPTSMLDPIALKIQSYIPNPTRAGQTNNFEQKGRTERQNEITSIKIDHSFSPKSRISFYDHYYRTLFANNGADWLPEPITALRHGYARTHTLRIGYDYTINPKLLVHVGAGMVRQRVPDNAVEKVLNYDSVKELGLKGAVDLGFPWMFGLSGPLGGMSLNLGVTNAQAYYTDKPSANVSATWVRGNHFFKAGAEWHRDIYSNRNRNNTYGNWGFSTQQTTLPSTQGMNLSGGSIGFAYASFLLGRANSASISNASDPQYRKEAWSVYLQDTWKLTRRLTVDYGLRWDYIPAMHELYDRVSGFDPSIPNPAAGGLLGATAYEGWGPGRCNCRFAETYPFALGPRLGIAYRINSQTVFRAGAGITYSRTADFTWMGSSIGVGYNSLSFGSTSYGDPAATFADGMQYQMSDLYQANFNPGIRPQPGQINVPGAMTDRNGGRPPRVIQWSIGLQREIVKDLVVDVSYVGNRGAWFEANSLIDLNAISIPRLQSFGLDLNNENDRKLLTSRLDSALAASRGFNNLPYSTYSKANTVAQSLRPFPQFGTLSVRWAPLGNTWYDSLQVKATKRFSHGIEFTSSYTWQKELSTLGGVNDVFNRKAQKSLDGGSIPHSFVINFNYTVPKLGPNRWMREVTGGWIVSGILRYASGSLISVPGSSNALGSLLFRGTRMTRVKGQPLYNMDINCNTCFDPRKDFVLNPKAWVDAPAGQFSDSPRYYNDFRNPRHPDEQLSLGRNFPIKERVSLSIRMEFFNVFNRLVLANPSSGNPLSTQTRDSNNVPTSGYGYINTATILSSSTSGMFNQRYGQLVMRLQF